MATNLKDMNRQTVEIIVVIVLYGLAYFFLIGPAIGAVTGFDTPVITFVGVTPTFTLSARTLLLFVMFFIVFYGYIYIKPRLVGDDPNEYWDM